ncbi:hypothetical protein [Actinophytocola sp.]|uniref:hypothetical protein n=1 Tax=Actinophytocola sp. TaxID=1872138 RepID=UPI003899ABB8
MDRELAAALAGELPAAAHVKAAQAVPVTLDCGAEDSGAAFNLAHGTISVVLVSASDTTLSPMSADGAQATATTSDGRQVLVVSEPTSQGDSPPYESDLNHFATEVAKIY